MTTRIGSLRLVLIANLALLALQPACALASDITLDASGDWFAQFLFSKAKFGNSFVIERVTTPDNSVFACRRNQPPVLSCPGGTSAAQCQYPDNPTALFNTADPNDCPDICPGGQSGSGSTEITCAPGDPAGNTLFQLFLGTFPAGTALQARKDVDKNKDGTTDLSWHSDPTKDNDPPGGPPFPHLRTTSLGPGVIRLEWEDLPFALSDQDYNDGVYLLIRYPPGGAPNQGWRIGNVVAGTSLHFVPRVSIDPIGNPSPRRLHLDIVVYNEDTNPATVAVCSMLNFALQGSPGTCSGPEGAGVFAELDCYPSSGAAIPQVCGSVCAQPAVRFSLTDGRFVDQVDNEIQTVPGLTNSGPGQRLWSFHVDLNQLNPPLDNLSPDQILSRILRSAEQLYVDFLPNTAANVQASGLQLPFQCPSGINVETDLTDGTSVQGFKFAWTAPTQNISSPVTFRTALHNAVTMTSPVGIPAWTDVTWQEIDPVNPVGATLAVNPPVRTPFTLDQNTVGEGSVTLNFPSPVSEGFVGALTQYVTRVDTGGHIVSQTLKAVRDTTPPVVESARVQRDPANQLIVDLVASDATSSVNTVSLLSTQNNASPVTAFMQWQNGTFITNTTFKRVLGPFPADAPIGLQTLINDEVGNVVQRTLPVAHAGLDRNVECTSPSGGPATLDGSRTTGITPLTFSWTGPFGAASGVAPVVALPFGQSCIALDIQDPSSLPASDHVAIIVVDTTPPSLTVAVTPTCLWPPNHKYVPFRLGQQITATAADTCDPNPVVQIVGVVSDQPDNGTGDGSTTDDVIFGGDGFCIRSERQGSSARTYTVTVRAADHFGNIADRQVQIEVPDDQSGHCATLPNSTFVTSPTDPLCQFAPAQPPPSPPSTPPPPVCGPVS